MGEPRGRFSVMRLAGRARAALRYAAGEAVLGLRRNGLMSIAAVTTIMVALILVGAGAMLSMNLRRLAVLLERQVEVVAYLKDGLTDVQRDRARSAARAIPGVRSVEFVGRDRALQRLQAVLGERVPLRDIVRTNPLPDSFELAVDRPAEAGRIAAAVRGITGVEDVGFASQVFDRVLAAAALLRVLGAGAALLLAAVALIIIMNTVRLTILSRRQEIEIMSLVGAGPWYVRSPFLLEGALEGLLATVLAAGVLVPSYLLLVSRLRHALPFIPVAPAGDVLPPLVAALAAGGALVGTGGSTLALRRFLRA